ncbi:hypothetical protein J6590_040434 [Homalodisca vitripennis]|nr:hypothetical protein J6590_040434 [Homalodisca vitripennis]
MPFTRSSGKLLEVLDGLDHLDQHVIDLAAGIFTELRTVEKLVPHVTSLIGVLNSSLKENSDMKHHIEALQDDLTSAKHRCLTLDNSFKRKSIKKLKDELRTCKADNTRLQETVDRGIEAEVTRMLAESQEKIVPLTSERRGLLKTLEVLEVDIKSLRAELRSEETRAKHRRSSFADTTLIQSPSQAESTSVPSCSQQPVPVTVTQPVPAPPVPDIPKQGNGIREFSNVLLIGDSHLRHSSAKCWNKEAFVEFCPGGKVLDVSYRGGPGYNGNHGKREALHNIAELLYTARTQFPDTKIVLNSVFPRRDIGYKAMNDFNSQLELMCGNIDVLFDGVHFNKRGVSRLSSLFKNHMYLALLSVAPLSSDQESQGEPATAAGSGSEVGEDTPGDHEPRESPSVSRASENKCLRFAHLNMRSLNMGFEEMCSLVSDFEFDAFGVSETWLHPSTSSDNYTIPGHCSYRERLRPHTGIHSERLSWAAYRGVYRTYQPYLISITIESQKYLLRLESNPDLSLARGAEKSRDGLITFELITI